MPLHSAAPAARPPQLGAADWIEAALDALVDNGIEAVQITQLAKALCVTRGSFYWHFEDREALLDALLAEWRARNTGVMIGAVDGASSLTDGILELFFVWVDHNRFDPRLDQAVRDWARRAKPVHAMLAREDDNRVAAIARFFERFGYDNVEAFIRARVIYFTQLGYYALVEDEPYDARRGYLAAYFRCFTGQEIAPDAAARFLARLKLAGAAP